MTAVDNQYLFKSYLILDKEAYQTQKDRNKASPNIEIGRSVNIRD